jgi:hypothetical protein
MPERDRTWGLTTYGWIDERAPFARLVRWASAGPYPDYPDRVIELAAIPLIWTLSSPNRIMRDCVTKALCHLLAPRLALLPKLLTRFGSVNDPYVLERVAVITHGAILMGGSANPASALLCARMLAAIALDPAVAPDVLVRDAARGAMEWCLRSGLIDAAEYSGIKPPYSAEPPEKPRTRKQLEKAYARFERGRESPGYSSIFSSVFDYGDFGRYVIESDVGRFSRYPLSRPVPPVRKGPRRKPDAAKLAELYAQFSEDQQASFDSGDWKTLIDTLDGAQRWDLLAALDPPRRVISRTYPTDLAQSWVFERVLSLGWTPERLGRFDHNYSYDSRTGRSGHKPERFGKKYQWIAFRELMARIADNFHMSDEWGDERLAYDGPWRFYGRQIDPTLPPARRLRDDDGVEYFADTFAVDPGDAWWVPPGPRYTGEQPPATAGWAETPKDIPEMSALVHRTDEAGVNWVVLHAYYNWDEHPSEDQERDDRPRRDMWSHIFAWLVKPDDARRLYRFLNSQSLMGQWMPMGREITDDAYVPEMPWAAAAHEYSPNWEAVEPRYGDDPDPPGLEVYPAWEEYYWEGNVWDCSIDDGVRVMVPAEELFEAGGLKLTPGSREWTDESDTKVAQHVESDGDRRIVLLVRADWLSAVIDGRDWSLVVGWLGEKQLLGVGIGGGLLGGWSEINGVAMLHRGKWTFGPRRVEVRHPAQRGPSGVR